MDLAEPTVDYWCPEYLRGRPEAVEAAQEAWQRDYDAYRTSIEGQVLPRDWWEWGRQAAVGNVRPR